MFGSITSKSTLNTTNHHLSTVSDQNSTIGGNVTFSVDANGTNLIYQWQKQDTNGTWVNIDGANASSYAINSVQTTHAGTYRVAIGCWLAARFTAPTVC